ncbi:glycosyl transferase [Desulfosarcina alkanivorans]|uniref:Glycosyl transferase n=1 Tax=Desulfosarcina alkanivorans TaxID=571177 RepID=A0A5K7YDX7_9BACT|nr:glycosyltransferase family 4 protein [Desulfosarcina alkanivorans]BBO67278.1 glycosyl transferase [Desulfosarcina alkanivorans]
MNEDLMATIKVAYILTPITYGGAEKVSFNFLKTVDRHQFDITPILLLRPWEEPPLFVKEIVKLGYEYITLTVSLKPGGGPLRVPKVAWRLLKLLKIGNFDLVHTHGYFADICAIPMARILSMKTITTCHGFITNDKRLRLYNRLNVCAIKLCQQVVAVSEGIKGQLIASGVRSQKITVIPNAVEVTSDDIEIARWRVSKRKELQIDDGDFVVGFLGRLSREKGVHFLIEAVADLIKDGLSIRLLIVGDGDERANLLKQVIQRCIKQNVTFAGFQTDTQCWLSAFDLFTLPSLTEGTPLALLEAMAIGVPVVATKVGGVPKVVISEHNGLLVEPGNVDTIAKAIRRAFEDQVLTGELSAEAQKTIAAEYNAEQWCLNIEKLYIEITIL